MTAIALLVSLAFGLLGTPLATAAPPHLYRIGRLSAGSPPPDPAFQQTLRTSAMWRGTTSAWRSAMPRVKRTGSLPWRPNWSGSLWISSWPPA